MKLSTSALPVFGSGCSGAAAGLAPVAAAGAPAAVEGVVPGAGATPGAPGCVAGAVGASAGSVVVAPGAPGAPGAAGAPGPAPVAGAVCGGAAGSAGAAPVAGASAGEPVAGGGVWPNEVSTSVREQREAVSSFFIGVEGKFCLPARHQSDDCPVVIRNGITLSRAKLFAILIQHFSSEEL